MKERWKHTESVFTHSCMSLYLSEKRHTGRERASCQLLAFHLSMCTTSTPSQTHLCGCQLFGIHAHVMLGKTSL